ncbi:hypothetical protein FDECE_13732 [Fusarium decemcellulare]|nr:hypothetical protein FDECE_13732 [Fusarium decemcellulare]
MASSPASSEATNEDPTGTRSFASQATVTIIPQNAEAKLAFTEVVDWLLEKSQGATDDDKSRDVTQERVHANNYMWSSSRSTRDRNVGRLMVQIRTDQPPSSSPSSSGQHAPSDDTDINFDADGAGREIEKAAKLGPYI